MLKKIAPLFIAGLILSGCSGDRIISSRSQVTIPQISPSLFVCPQIDRWPDPDELTDIQIARLLVELRRNNQICRNSLEAIKTFLERAREISSSDAR